MTMHRGETATVYAQHAAVFAANVAFLHELLMKAPHLRGVEAHILPREVAIVAIGGCGVVRDWTRSLPPVVRTGTGLYVQNQLAGITDVLSTDPIAPGAGRCTVEIRRPL